MIDLFSAWLISRSINAWDIKVQHYLTFFELNRILLCFFFLFIAIFNNFFITPVVKENIKLKLALAIPTRTTIISVKQIIDIPPLAADKTIKFLSK